MTPIASHITAFLRERLPLQRRASHHTCESYAYTFQLLFAFASQRLALAPSNLCLEHLDAQLVMDFLAHLETQRGNSPSTAKTNREYGKKAEVRQGTVPGHAAVGVRERSHGL